MTKSHGHHSGGGGRFLTSSSYREKAPEPTSTSYSSYLFLRNKQTPPWREDDEDGHYRYHLGENFTKRYKILSHLGEGTFGKVIECWDRLTKKYVAIKVIRNVPKYRVAGMLELEVLNTIKKHRKYNKGGAHCVQFKEWFDYRGHICIVFSKLGLTLFDLLRKNSYRPFDLFHVQRFSKQLLETVSFLHSIHLIHTDLKPENILLPSHKYFKVPLSKGSKRGKRIPEKSDISLIDFGSATFEDRHHSKVVSTRHYRAPEVMLGLSWSYPCDIWSVGCIMVELVTGEALFKTHDNLEHLAMMQKVLGVIPASMVKKMQAQSSASSSSASAAGGGANNPNPNPAREYFEEKDGTLAWPQRCDLNDSVQAVNELKDLWGIISEKCDLSVLPAVEKLVDLLKSLLHFDPEKRISAKEALEHSFFAIQE
jgi:dual-specificity kinase